MKNFLYLPEQFVRLFVMAITPRTILTLTALLVAGCATQNFEQPVSLG